jgi:hypothetical protein
VNRHARSVVVVSAGTEHHNSQYRIPLFHLTPSWNRSDRDRTPSPPVSPVYTQLRRCARRASSPPNVLGLTDSRRNTSEAAGVAPSVPGTGRGVAGAVVRCS